LGKARIEAMESTTLITPRSEGPDFVGIGVQKCGTTWLGDILSQHPDVLVEKKEISFYTHHFHKGYNWYHNWFKEKNGRIAGEITVSYLFLPRPDSFHKEFYPKRNPKRTLLFWRKQPSARDQLLEHYPGLRVFAIFRNPADRAWSHYWFWRNRRERMGKRIVPFEDFFAADARWVQTHGLYADHLAYWREAFPDMGVYLFDDLKNDPDTLIKDLYRFVGVRDDFTPVIGEKVNAGRYEKMPKEVRTQLIAHYRDQIERFSVMIGRDLTPWLQR